jgi:hypothetical protein
MSDEIDTRERMLDAALGAAGRGPDRVDVHRARSTADRSRRAEAVNRLAS